MKTALVIEDDDNNLLLITDLLELAGFRVRAARTGADGLEAIFAERPDFVVLDIGLPDMDGTEVLRRIRAAGINGELPIIAMTSYAMTGDRQRLLGAGCSAYIEKPINPATVIDQIRRAIEPDETTEKP